MRFQTELIPATLLKRYKRFLADCRLEDGREVVAHVANPGSMMGLAEPGLRLWLEPNDDPKKKLKFAWRLADLDGVLVGVDTGAANRIVRAALEARAVTGLDSFDTLRAEVAYSSGSRVDFLLGRDGGPDTYVEVKSVTLSRVAGVAEFPDSVTARGLKHLAELSEVVTQGHRAVMLYLVQRDDCDRVTVAADIDPGYAAGLAKAMSAGVEVLALGTRITPKAIVATGPLPFSLEV